MIDSVRLTVPCRMHNRTEMRALGFSPTCGHTERGCQHAARWKLNLRDSSRTLPRITWSEAPTRLHYLTAEVALPKMLYGSNIYLLDSDAEINRGLQAISGFVSEATNVKFDARGANVSRVDFCHNWHLAPNEVCEYLRALGSAMLPRMTRVLIDDGTVQFSSKTLAVVFYDKLRETISRLPKGRATNQEVIASYGVLRCENRFLNHRLSASSK